MNSNIEKISNIKKSKKIKVLDEYQLYSSNRYNIWEVDKMIKKKLELNHCKLELLRQKLCMYKVTDSTINVIIYNIQTEIDNLLFTPSPNEYRNNSFPILYNAILHEGDNKLIKEHKIELLGLCYHLYPSFSGITTVKDCVPYCCDTPMEFFKEEYTCNNCGKVEGIYFNNSIDSLSYNESKDAKCNLVQIPVYKKSGHLREKLDQKLANIKNNIAPPDIVDKVKTQLKVERITDLSKVTTTHIKDILKKLGLERYYELEYTIFYNITGIKILEFDDNLISKIERMFAEVSDVFEKLSNKGRSSMFVYDYTIHKILELLDLDEYKKHFKPPKNPEKVIEYDILWKRICKVLMWEFVPTNLN